MWHVVAHGGIYVAGSAAAVEATPATCRPATKFVACVTARFVLFILASFWAFLTTPGAQKITLCRALVLCGHVHGAHTAMLQKGTNVGRCEPSRERIFV